MKIRIGHRMQGGRGRVSWSNTKINGKRLLAGHFKITQSFGIWWVIVR
jgi:hypothetical protein